MIGADGSGQPDGANLRWDLGVAATVALAWAGFFIHNVADLPGQAILGPESLLPTFVWLVALGMWVAPATRRAGMWALLVWTVINLVGGAGSDRDPPVVLCGAGVE